MSSRSLDSSDTASSSDMIQLCRTVVRGATRIRVKACPLYRQALTGCDRRVLSGRPVAPGAGIQPASSQSGQFQSEEVVTRAHAGATVGNDPRAIPHTD